MTEETLFAAALEKATPAEQAALLDAACTGDSALRRRVEALLESHEQTDFLKTPAIQHAAEALGGQGDARTIEAAPTGADESEFALNFLATSEKPGSLGRLGHYEILEVIGRGGMGIVLRGFDEKLHRVVAIKVMAVPLATSAAARRRFTREAQAAAAVSHDHIVTIHAVEEVDGLPYLVMQYVAGMSLQDRLDGDRPLQLAEILRIAMQTASGLAAAHAQGLIHRDIKPANILLENGVERVKITDFGLARAADDASLTQSGVVAGTPQYMAPEQARGESIDQRADLFSLGSVLYAMCTGRAPFRASGTIAVLKRVCEQSPTPIRDTNPEIPDWLVAIIDKLHAKDPAERYQSAAAVAEVLGRHLAHVQHPSVVPLPIASPSTSPHGTVVAGGGRLHGHRRRSAVTAAVLLMVLGGLSLTEATGVTSLATRVIRIFTPDGTLVVETDDPGVKITVEGDDGLFIGTGLDEIRLRPGSYKVHADRDGKRVPLERDLVSIARGGREVVKVKLEGVSAQTAVNSEKGAFVLLAAGKERQFNALVDAALTATDGDTIEVRGNGPFLTDAIEFRTALTIRAGAGFRPVLKFVTDKPNGDLISTSRNLVLEGLEIRDVAKGRRPTSFYSMILSRGDSLDLANCRLLQEQPYNPYLLLITAHLNIRMRNCEFYCPTNMVCAGNDIPWRIEMNNCVGLGGFVTYVNHSHAVNPATVEYRRNTLIALWGVATVGFSAAPDLTSPADATKVKRIRFESTSNVFDLREYAFRVEPINAFRARTIWKDRDDAEKVFVPVVGWREQCNVYPPAATSIAWCSTTGDVHPLEPAGLKEWERFWGLTNTGSLEGRIRFQGGDLSTRMAATGAEMITPEDFRLRSDSAGYRAGQDGKDLGADVDLVGPGPAYERWKTTPEYEKWVEETRPSK